MPTRPEGTTEALFARGDRMAADNDWETALGTWRWAYIDHLPELRGLAFKWPVTARFMRRADLQKRMHFEVNKEWPADVLEANRKAFVAFDFMDPTVDLGKTMTQLYTEEVAGFYDPETKELYLIEDLATAKPHPLDIGGWFKRGLSDPVQEQKAILAHELEHALADQHFDLFSLHASAKDDEDKAMALTGLIEGEAMVAMVLAILPRNEQRDFLASPPGLVATLMEMIVPVAASFAAGKTFRNAPRIFKETLLVPYTQGLRFCLAVLQDGGWAGLNAAFTNPPVSTEQLLHPEAYLNAKEDPAMVVTHRAALPGALAGWTLVKHNTLGELPTRILLKDALPRDKASAAAAGWDGDTYRVLEKDDQLLLVWTTVWDDITEAMQFEAALGQRFPPAGGRRVSRKENAVVLLDGVPDNAMDDLDTWAHDFELSPKRFVIKTQTPKIPFPATPDPSLARELPPTGVPIPAEPPMARAMLDSMGVTQTALIEQAEAFAQQACTCTDAACQQRVVAAQDRWYTKIRSKKIHPLDFERVERAAKRMLGCVAKLRAAPESDPAVTPTEAPK